MNLPWRTIEPRYGEGPHLDDIPEVSTVSENFSFISHASLVAQLVKNLPAKKEMQVRSLGWEDPLEKEIATHFSTLTWEIPWTEEPDIFQSIGWQVLDIT